MTTLKITLTDTGSSIAITGDIEPDNHTRAEADLATALLRVCAKWLQNEAIENKRTMSIIEGKREIE